MTVSFEVTAPAKAGRIDSAPTFESAGRVWSHRVDVIDATGAGDCFCGNLLARIALGDSLFTAARYANAAAAIAVQGFGAVAPLPRPDQVKALL